MSRDFPIRIDLAKLGLPERTIRVLEKAALIVDAIERITGTETDLGTVNGQIDTINEAIEDQGLSLESLDARLDEQENGNGPYVKKTGDVMSGALNVNDLVECDSLRINTAPAVAAAVASTHTVAVNLNGTVYYLLASNV